VSSAGQLLLLLFIGKDVGRVVVELYCSIFCCFCQFVLCVVFLVVFIYLFQISICRRFFDSSEICGIYSIGFVGNKKAIGSSLSL